MWVRVVIVSRGLLIINRVVSWIEYENIMRGFFVLVQCLTIMR